MYGRQDTFTPLSPTHLIGTHVCVLVYSFEDEESLQLVSMLYQKIADASGLQQQNATPIIMVGTKADTSRHVFGHLQYA